MRRARALAARVEDTGDYKPSTQTSLQIGRLRVRMHYQCGRHSQSFLIFLWFCFLFALPSRENKSVCNGTSGDARFTESTARRRTSGGVHVRRSIGTLAPQSGRCRRLIEALAQMALVRSQPAKHSVLSFHFGTPFCKTPLANEPWCQRCSHRPDVRACHLHRFMPLTEHFSLHLQCRKR